MFVLVLESNYRVLVSLKPQGNPHHFGAALKKTPSSLAELLDSQFLGNSLGLLLASPRKKARAFLRGETCWPVMFQTPTKTTWRLVRCFVWPLKG